MPIAHAPARKQAACRSPSPRLESKREPERAENLAHDTGVARRLQRALGVVADADAAAEVHPSDRKPDRAQFEDELSGALEGLPVRLANDELRPDINRKAGKVGGGGG